MDKLLLILAQNFLLKIPNESMELLLLPPFLLTPRKRAVNIFNEKLTIVYKC